METMNDLTTKNGRQATTNDRHCAHASSRQAKALPLGCFFLRSAFFILLLLASCTYPRPGLSDERMSPHTRDSLACLYERHYTWGTNLLVRADSVCLERLPLKGAYEVLRRGDRVVVAEVAVHPADSVDSVWVKLAHTQEEQGWLRECDMMRAFVPDDSISQAIHLFSDTHTPYFLLVLAAFTVVWLVRMARRKQTRQVFLNDIDSLYPLLLCLLMACCATLYESIQIFAPGTWQHFYFNPTLSPLHVPPVLAAFLTGLWLFVVVLLAALDDLFRQLPFTAAIAYLLGLAACCILCYIVFILTTRIYIGYALLALMTAMFLRRTCLSPRHPHYRCGQCGHKLGSRGTCPHCGALNE